MSKRSTTVQELQGMPERSAAGKAAVAYLGQKAEVEDGRLALAKAAEKLVEELGKAGKKSISVEGHVLSLKHVEADQILCKKAQSA